jgi:hypothetical protein
VPDIPLARSDYFRGIAKEARILTRNRYFEANPALTEQQTALIARPGLRRWIYCGEGPIRPNGIYSQPGASTTRLLSSAGRNGGASIRMAQRR